ncbi:MAG TPA: LPS assembly protein LptD [Paracoccaceae bacterium]|nr:LPS assembly protein LptD [Paracoccaceae bacterium]
MGALRLAALPLAALLMAAAGGPAAAQSTPSVAELAGLGPEEEAGPVSLVADRVRYDAEAGTLTAEGNVEVHYGERVLTAERIVYDRPADRVRAEGEVTLRGGPEGAVLVADLAELDGRLRDGLIRGARAALPRGARFAAVEGRRVDDRYNVLTRAVFSPCVVCPEDPTPLWRIRADRIVHDEAERTVHYENARFDVLGRTVFWTPYFRHPDPTLQRASGFLPPDYFQSTTFGHAVRVPWHWVIDEHSDATLAPIVTTEDGLLLDGEYRRRFADGALWLNGSITRQDYDGEDRLRGHLFGEGLWRLSETVETGFSFEQASDDGYLRRYEFTERDRLTSEAFLRAGDRDGWGEVAAVRFQSLRDGESFGDIPFALPTFEGRRVWRDGPAGGTFGLGAAGYALKRTDGQDTLHGSLEADWERRWVSDEGLDLGAYAALRADAWRLNDVGPTTDEARSRLGPLAAAEIRWPLLRAEPEGDPVGRILGGRGVQVLEPIAQLVLAPFLDDAPPFPDEDGLLTEFDETNLFSLRRHAGHDGFEEGPRLNLGLRWSRTAAGGADVTVAAGRVFRTSEISSFVPGSGLNGQESDYVAAWTLSLPGVVDLTNRVRVADDFDLNRNEIYASASVLGFDLEASYVWLAQDATTPVDRHEVAGSGRYALTRNWFVGGELRRDLEAEDWVRVGGEIGYADECVDLAFYAGRDFTRTDDVPASTFYGVRVRLWALGGEARAGPTGGACAPALR